MIRPDPNGCAAYGKHPPSGKMAFNSVMYETHSQAFGFLVGKLVLQSCDKPARILFNSEHRSLLQNHIEVTRSEVAEVPDVSRSWHVEEAGEGLRCQFGGKG